MYRNDSRLLCWNQNCDLPIRFETPTWRTKIVVKLRVNRGKIARFNSVNSEIIGLKFTKFGYYVVRLLPLNLLKTDLWLANPLSNVEAKSKGRSTRRLRISPKFNWLPQQRPFTYHKTNVSFVIPIYVPTYAERAKIGLLVADEWTTIVKLKPSCSAVSIC